VWVAAVEVEIEGMTSAQKAAGQALAIPVDADANTFPVSGGDFSLVPLTITVQPSGLPGLLSLNLPDNMRVYTARDKTGGPFTPAEWNLVLGDTPPATLFLGGNSASPNGAQTITASLQWGSGASPASLSDTVHGSVDANATPPIARLEVHPYHRYGLSASGLDGVDVSTEQTTGLGLTQAITLHLHLEAGQVLDPNTVSASVHIQENYQFSPGYQASCDLPFAGLFNSAVKQAGAVSMGNGGQFPVYYYEAYGSHWTTVVNQQIVTPPETEGQADCLAAYDPCAYRANPHGSEDMYQVVLWDTTTEPSTSYNGAAIPGIPAIGHNGNFTLSLNVQKLVNGQPTSFPSLDFYTTNNNFGTHYNVNSNYFSGGGYTFNSSAGQTLITPPANAANIVISGNPSPLNVKVSNVTIASVASSTNKANTEDYFKYDPDPSSPYHRPSVSCTLDDGSNSGQQYN